MADSSAFGRIFPVVRDVYTSEEMQEAAAKHHSRGFLLLLGKKNGTVRADDQYEQMLAEITRVHGKEGWDNPARLGSFVKEWMHITKEQGDLDGGIVINPYTKYSLECIGGYVNGVNRDKVIQAVRESEAIKGGRVKGKHTSGAFYTLKPGNTAIVGSESGSSVISFENGLVVPEYTIHNPNRVGFCHYNREQRQPETSYMPGRVSWGLATAVCK
ncbi:MAG: hypothetical protein JW716_02165 [Candidatus Aenigmarchaeota archaeon]|nr:hypothetical protein [Candidatus Aenigmarchaeota archaeon]